MKKIKNYMKKKITLILSLSMLLLCSCKSNDIDETEQTRTGGYTSPLKTSDNTTAYNPTEVTISTPETTPPPTTAKPIKTNQEVVVSALERFPDYETVSVDDLGDIEFYTDVPVTEKADDAFFADTALATNPVIILIVKAKLGYENDISKAVEQFAHDKKTAVGNYPDIAEIYEKTIFGEVNGNFYSITASEPEELEKAIVSELS